MARVTIRLDGNNSYSFDCDDPKGLIDRFHNETMVDIPISQWGEKVWICRYGVTWIEVLDQDQFDQHDDASISP